MENKPPDGDGKYFGTRHTLAVMSFLGFFNLYCMRVNLSVAMVAMVTNVATDAQNGTRHEGQCEPPSGTKSTPSDIYQGQQFIWDEQTQGLILGSFFYGYIVTMLPGGWMAQRIGGKNLFGIGVLSTAVLTLLTPLAAKLGVGPFVVLRILEGLGEGVTSPAMHTMWGSWAPVMERSKLVSFSISGSTMGTVISLPISGILCETNFLGGWPSVFYIFGTLGCLWFILWMAVVHDTPEKHPRISEAERHYIQNSIKPVKAVGTPWKSMFTSLPVLAICTANFAHNWGFYTMLTCLPMYMKEILRFNIAENGFLSALPYLLGWFCQVTVGQLADFIRSKRYLTTTATRKCIQASAFLIPAVLMSFISYLGCDHVPVVVMITLAVSLGGLSIGGGFVSNMLDVAPNFAGIILGISNTIGTVPGFLGPFVVGELTNGNQTREQWQTIFDISAGIYITGALVYVTMATGVEQPWNRPKTRSFEFSVKDNQGYEVDC